MFIKSSDSLLAIDLAPEAIRVLDVTVCRGSASISAVATGTLTEGNADSLPERHIAALEYLLNNHKLRSRKCVASLPTNLVTTRSLVIDPGKAQSPEEQIKLTLQNILTCDAKSLLFDFWKVTEPGEKSRTYEVLVVATQRTLVHKYLEGFKKLKLSCSHLDVAPCALASLLAKLVPQQDAMVGAVALGESLGYFAVVQNQRVLFWRPFEVPPARNGQQAGQSRVGDEISKCVSHMMGSQHLDRVSDIYLFGNSSQDDAFSSYLLNRFNLQIKTPSPFESLAQEGLPAELRKTLDNAGATHYAAALGLALQPAGGNHG
jgi:Tfp pilus assembly PilM family ATPase